MKTYQKITYAAVIFLLSVLSLSAWNGRGHMVVASITYQSLSDIKKIHYTDILKEHPAYQDWMNEFKEITDIEYGEFLFMRASTWPDEIRKTGNPNDHPEWHYMSYRIKYSGNLPAIEKSDTINILTQMEYCLEEVINQDLETNLRAISLSWFIHLAGDIHQPLHTASLFNTLYPKGDLGGNSINIIVKEGNHPTNLHSFWDGLLGTGKSFSAITKQSRSLISNNPRNTLPLADSLSFLTWAQESYQLAVTVAHKNGEIDKLSGIKSKNTAPLLPNATAYIDEANKVADNRVILAGYRLANTLSQE